MALTMIQMRNLINGGIIDTYAPLVDVQGSYTAQFEHVSTFTLPHPRAKNSSINMYPLLFVCFVVPFPIRF